ncbi:MAG: substrate-binding domain-containing protein [Christensenella sp.]|nr:substrate-binding domain-containing protein [Christensenella sp.]
MKKLVALTLCLLMVLAMFACTKAAEPATTDTATTDTAATEPAAPEAAAATPASYAIIAKSAGNPYMERMASGFEEVIKAAGAEAIVKYPAEITAEAQITLINELVAQGVSGIAVAANDADALETALKAAMDKDIKVVSLDSSVNPASRMTHINQAGVQQVAQCLVDAVFDLTGGSGDWAILSATSTATNQNAWIDAMKEILKDSKYAGMNLVEVAYGDDQFQKSVDQTQALIANYPNLKVICAPTTVGIAAASKVVTDNGLQGKLIITGLGLPSEMAEFMGSGNVACPYMFLWNPIDVGKVAAYTLLEMVNNGLKGAVGESFTADGNTYTVTEAGDGGTEIIIGPPFQFNADNIADWKDVY